MKKKRYSSAMYSAFDHGLELEDLSISLRLQRWSAIFIVLRAPIDLLPHHGVHAES